MLPTESCRVPVEEASATHVVIIPSFNSGQKLVETVQAARLHWNPVWVVVDGSTDGSPAIIQAMAQADRGLRVIVVPQNRGKGAAVLRGLEEASSAGFTHAITMDADGQHPAEWIPKFFRQSRDHPGAMILGKPIFDASAPALRVGGRRISNGWANLETLWSGVGDSLFGMRAYPIKPLLDIMTATRWMRRYDFDAEAAVRLVWAGVQPINLPTPVRYFRPEEGGVTHFRYGRDNVLLTGMHARLFIEFLLRMPILIYRRLTMAANANEGGMQDSHRPARDGVKGTVPASFTPSAVAFDMNAPTAGSQDVLVIGGGPAGSTISTLLVRKGWRVTLLEKDRHPRFHIGESLLPHNNPLLAELGVLEEVKAVGMVKPAAEFHSKYHGKSQTFQFVDALDRSQPTAFQVHRADFDHILLSNASRSGVEVIEETRVHAVDFHADGVRVSATGPAGERDWEARFLVDASGRDTFLAGVLRTKRANPRHRSAAIFGHYEGARRNAGNQEGNISIYWFDHGWIWFIPLARGVTSIGAVCWPYYLKSRTGTLEQFFDQTIENVPELAKRLIGARRVAPVTATGNYSYEASQACGSRYLMVGDAYAFVDPIFSSGVYLAMASSFAGAEVVDAALRDPAKAGSLMRYHERRMRRALRIFKWFIYRMTTPTMRMLIMGPKDVFGVVQGLVGFLAGDVFQNNGVLRRVWLFKGLYYLFSAISPVAAWSAMRRHKRNIRPAASEPL
jgi:flavin-dependent dehydrogenase